MIRKLAPNFSISCFVRFFFFSLQNLYQLGHYYEEKRGCCSPPNFTIHNSILDLFPTASLPLPHHPPPSIYFLFDTPPYNYSSYFFCRGVFRKEWKPSASSRRLQGNLLIPNLEDRQTQVSSLDRPESMDSAAL
uniref:Uncharacterized protein n=1 Tax=Cacopsylla melanoneura TaxID=428564 RepID=A0A8D8TRN7_9HEMI